MNSFAENILWADCSDSAPLDTNEIHVWATTLDFPVPAIEAFAATLSSDELDRANRFKFGELRNRFIAGRGALRAILASYLEQRPADLRFAYSENGKPMLAEEFAGAKLHFNLAHTGNLALIALTRVGVLGVDIESVRPIKNVDELVARFFSARENELFQKVAITEKPAAFFNLWTRKEALLKATGEGLTGSLSLVEVSFLSHETAQVLAIPGNPKTATRWVLRELSPALGITGAMAVDGTTLNTQRSALNTEHRTLNAQRRTPKEDLREAGAFDEVVVKCWKWNPNFAEH